MPRFAVKTPTHHTTWKRMLEIWQAADEIDLYESAWNFDHFYPIRGDTDASMASTLDVVSSGRFELGLGAGWYQLEADAYGIDLGTVDERMSRFEEGTEVIDLLLTREHTDFAGQFFTLRNARNEPKRVQHPRPPIVIGARGEKRTLRLVARYASMWDALFVEEEIGEWRRLKQVMLDHCRDVGRDPAEISCSGHLSLGPHPIPMRWPAELPVSSRKGWTW